MKPDRIGRVRMPDGLSSRDYNLVVHDGCCYAVGSQVIERVQPWGEGAGAWRRARGGEGWRQFVPEIRLPALEAFLEEAAVDARAGMLGQPRRRRRDAYRYLLELVPARVREAVASFGEGHWELLQVANHNEAEAVEVMKSNPAVAFLIARAAAEDATHRAAELLRRKRREVVAMFGFPGSQSSVKVLGKIPPGEVTQQLLERVQEAMGDGQLAKTLRHIPAINAAAAELVASPTYRAHATVNFCAELGQRSGGEQVMERLRFVLTESDRRGVRAPRFDSLEQLMRRVRELQEPPPPPPRARRAPPRDSRPFPAPPVPETDFIRAIRTPAELHAEGEAMNHCAGGYVAMVQRGERYFYHLTWPEKGTVCIEPGRGRWRLSEAEGYGNRPLRSESRDLIRRWLRGQGWRDGDYFTDKRVAGGRDLWRNPPAAVRRRLRGRAIATEQLEFDFGG